MPTPKKARPLTKQEQAADNALVMLDNALAYAKNARVHLATAIRLGKDTDNRTASEKPTVKRARGKS